MNDTHDTELKQVNEQTKTFHETLEDLEKKGMLDGQPMIYAFTENIPSLVLLLLVVVIYFLVVQML
jgi:hypothetical protein